MTGKHLQTLMPSATYLGSSIDLRDYNKTLNYLNVNKFDIVVHLAAQVGGIKANLDKPVKYFEDNILINTNTLKASYQTGVKRFIGILSTCAYPDIVDHYPMDENDLHKGPPSISNLGYGYSKRCLALQIEAYNNQYNTQYQYLIPSNLYSEYDTKSENESHFINSLIHKIIQAEKENKKEITLWGTGKSLRQCTYALDFSKIIYYIIKDNITDSFNISEPNNYSINEIAQIALLVLNKNDWKINYINSNLDGQYRKDVSIDKMKKYFPNFEFTTLQQGIKKVYNEIKKQI